MALRWRRRRRAEQKIKKQIRECMLFIAVVSAHTDARIEGYLRRERNSLSTARTTWPTTRRLC